MRFTEHEMVFLNSITKGNTVFGIPLNFRAKEGHKEEVNKTIRGLVEKKVLKSETELSELGVLPARALELYKESKAHIIVNYLHIALIEKQEAIVIIPTKNREYELLRLPRMALIYLLLDRYPILRNAGKITETKAEMIEHDAFLRKLKEYDGNIMVGAFQEDKIVSEHVYYWKENQMYRYDLNQQLRKEVNSVQVRRELLKLLQIKEGAENYGR